MKQGIQAGHTKFIPVMHIGLLLMSILNICELDLFKGHYVIILPNDVNTI